MSTQLQRKFGKYTYYCEFISVDKNLVNKRKQSYKEVGFLARIVELQDSGKRVYGVFVRDK